MNNKIIIEDCKRVVDKVDLSELDEKKVLITGATGLIGTYLLFSIDEYISRSSKKIQVTIIVHNSLPKHLEAFTKYQWLTIIVGDLTDSSFLDSIGNYDIVIHAAGYGQPGKFMEKPEKTLLLNTYSTYSLLKKTKEGGKFLFLSTSEIYSGSKEYPYKENTTGVTMPDHARSCYIEGKRCGEAFCFAYKDRVDVKIARIALAFGPGTRLDDRRVLYNFIQKGFEGEITMLDEGKAQRVYCYITDTVEMLLNILLFGKETVYNVGGIEHISIKELAELVAKQLNVKVTVPLNNNNSLEEAPEVVNMDMSRVINEFNKDSFVSIDEGVYRTVSWYSQYFTGKNGRI